MVIGSSPPRGPGLTFSVMWLHDLGHSESTYRYEQSLGWAWRDLLRDDDWRAWFEAHRAALDHEGNIWSVEARDRLLIRKNPGTPSVSLYLPTSLLESSDEYPVAVLVDVLRRYYRRLAGVAGVPAPPAVEHAS